LEVALEASDAHTLTHFILLESQYEPSTDSAGFSTTLAPAFTAEASRAVDSLQLDASAAAVEPQAHANALAKPSVVSSQSKSTFSWPPHLPTQNSRSAAQVRAAVHEADSPTQTRRPRSALLAFEIIVTVGLDWDGAKQRENML